jgi:hypothetical protein
MRCPIHFPPRPLGRHNSRHHGAHRLLRQRGHVAFPRHRRGLLLRRDVFLASTRDGGNCGVSGGVSGALMATLQARYIQVFQWLFSWGDHSLNGVILLT